MKLGNSNTTLVKVKYYSTNVANLFTHSNTTLVKVKFISFVEMILGLEHSNTTLGKYIS